MLPRHQEYIGEGQISPQELNEQQAPNSEQQELPKFAWGSRWLKGHEYGLMLEKVDEYCQKFGLAKFRSNEHPLQIYQLPQNGRIYFIQGSTLEAFGFPRINERKTYRWKKMNFVTNLPKQNPIVKYIVASSFKRGSLVNIGDQYRMHVVIPYRNQSNFILCHIKKVGEKETIKYAEENVELQQCFKSGQPNFYRLFAFLHNHHSIQK